jgi:hypothetical protein
MKGCVLVGKVKFEDGAIPDPVWPASVPDPVPVRDPE